MRFTALLAPLLALTLGLPGISAPSAQAAQETVVSISSGPTFPWGLLGILGLMGLARRHPPRRVRGPVQAATTPADTEPSDSWEQTGELGQLEHRVTDDWPPAAPERVTAEAATAEQVAWSETPDSEQQPSEQRLSERLNQRPPGAPDLSKPPGRR
ncbi:hypothetical protein GCM10017783_24630 [Deinococcus piscis]|uniref:Uncharacterized protein n=1 Tax=Deinococcus piscis TaxID=394230 RepID=A0ABQ3KFJ8_9DEIO|nr:hypothetical protein [Deinococcus piscis]GHG11367.1 hypothetical protein GCM10017783_24630 [Deinococcus piscis]